MAKFGCESVEKNNFVRNMKQGKRLAMIPGGTDHDRSLVAFWIADWEIYLADRLTHANRLRSDGDVKPLLTALPSGSGSFLERMNGFARVNDFEACLDPGDM